MTLTRALVAAVFLAAPTLRAQTGAGVPVAQEFEKLHFRSIGPAIMSGRISDLAVYEKDPAIFYVATAHGGVWKTTSGGSDFQPIFDDVGMMSIGCVTVSQSNPDLVWVGTGEVNNRQTTSFGDGVYKSTDGGKTFTKMGLARSQHVARIVIDPTNDNIVLVASNGSLFGAGGDRGVFKTTDGGRTWKNVLQTDSLTGATELVMAAADHRIMYAATYQRRRFALGMTSTGPGSAVWKSTDGGDTWTKLAGGLPTGSLGRVGLAIFRPNPNVVYAAVEVGGGRGAGRAAADSPDDSTGGGGAGGRGGRGGRGGGGGGRGGAPGAAPAPAGGTTGLYRTDDGGATWRFVSDNNPRPNYFSQVRIDPNDPDRIMMGGVGVSLTVDGGKTWELDAAMVVHDDIHALWINPNNSSHILIGGDGGIGMSRDRGKHWTFVETIVAGLFYHVQYDMQTPFSVCGGMQDNFVWCGPSASRFYRGIMAYDWQDMQGGDGFEAVPDLRDWRIVYVESQNGGMIRRNRVTGESKSIKPSPENVVNAKPGDPPMRFNWDTPIALSPLDPGILYTAAQRMYKSNDRGDTWTAISPDLTKQSSIYTFAESPKLAGVIYAGSDDGSLWMTKDGGKAWVDIQKNVPGFPNGGVVSEVVPSRYDAARVYVTVDNHYENDFEPYIWESDDYGATFHSINSNLKGTNVRTLTEDTRNQDVLYIGTESGIFLTLDRAKSWKRLKANLPMVQVDELTIMPRDNSLIVATHGRALWILDHLEAIQEYSVAQSSANDAHLLLPPTALQWKAKDDKNDEFWGHDFFTGENPPVDAVIQVMLKKPVADLKLRISDAAGATVRELPVAGAKNQAGIQTICWDQRVEPISGGRGAGGGGGGGRGGAPAAGGGGGLTPLQMYQGPPSGGPPTPGGAVPPGTGPIQGYPTPLPTVGHLPEYPCGFPSGRGGGGAGAGPQVLPGTYNVALVAGDKVLETKPIKIVMDPGVTLTGPDRVKWNAILMDLHDLEKRGTQTEAQLSALYPQLQNAADKVKLAGKLPAALQTQFDALQRDFDAVRVKFGVGPARDSAAAPAAGGRGGRGGGGGGGGRGGRGGAGGGADAANVLARAGSVKTAIGGIWELPSPALMQRYTDVKVALPAAIAEANAVIAKANAIAPALKQNGIELTVGK
ncbi:MAG TPA: hypothetical protein VE967_01180 [Gemmatimonadaceae bacterium]|nr:hypothetical protein [Gemmatimonadaceae bacterium]